MMKPTSLKRFLRLLRYAAPYKRNVAIQFLLMAFSIGIGLLRPWPLKYLVDSVAGGRPFAIDGWTVAASPLVLLAALCLAYLILHAGDSLVQLASTTTAAATSSKMIRDLRTDLLSQLNRLSLRFHDQHRVGDLAHRISYNTAAVETAFQSGFMGVVKSLLTLVFMFVVMLLMNPLLTAVALAVVPLLLLCIRTYAKSIHAVSRRHQDQEGAVSSRAFEILSAVRLVKAFNREPLEESRFEEVCTGSVNTRLKTTLAQGIFGFATALSLALGTVLLFWMGFRQILSNRLTIGEFLVFNSYLAMLYAPLSVLSYTASSVQSALGGGERLFEILEEEPDVRESEKAQPLRAVRGEIRFESVDFHYRPDEPVLKKVGFVAQPREMTAIVGETGSGKSTLLNLMVRFYDPQGGRIRIDGHDLRDLTLSSLRDSIGLAPQETFLFSDSIRENIAYGRPGATDAEIEEAAGKAEAHEFIARLPEGYDTLVGERGVRLSMGQRQRVALARAFLKNSPILLLDEPTSALDAETEERLIRRFEESKRDKTLVVVAHRLSCIRGANRVVVLKHGEVVETGSHQDLLAAGGAYARMWRSQMGLPMVSEAGRI